ncbi:MAG: hypothetical protein IJT32_06825 [Lachnospiraceae bacterium]|nr:hypothetical protein [Lachnospiraceae bacterium]
MIKTYNELYKFAEESNDIDDNALSILHELDETRSVVTQASLNEILLILYRRLSKVKLRIAEIGDNVTKEQFKAWVEEKFDSYTANLFKNSI